MKKPLIYIVIALIAFVIGALVCSKYMDNRKPEIKIERDTVRVKEVDSTKIKFLEQELSKAKAIKEKVEIKVPFQVVKKDTVYVDTVKVNTNKYVGTEELENGKVHYEIYADSLHAYSFKLETEKEIIKERIEITLPPKSALFIGGGVDYGEGVQSAELGLMYNRRQKWQVGISINQDFTANLPQNMRTTVGIKAYIKI